MLDSELAREDARAALHSLERMARSDTPVTHERLLALLEELHEPDSDPEGPSVGKADE